MRYGICEGFKFLIDGLKFSGSLAKFLVEFANFFFPSLALSNVVVRFKDCDWIPQLVSLQRPSARHNHAGSIGFRFLEFALPSACAQQLRLNLCDRRRKDCL